MPPTPLYVGIDVAKAQLDIAVRPSGDRWAIPNTEAGRQDALTRLTALPPTLVLLDAAGGLALPLVAALAAAGLPVVVVNPRHVRDFARATGQLAKTDALDARALAHFAEAVRPGPCPMRPPKPWRLCWRGDSRWWPCWWLRKIASVAQRPPSAPGSRPISPGWNANCRRSTRTWTGRCAIAPCGASKRTCCAVSLGWGRN